MVLELSLGILICHFQGINEGRRKMEEGRRLTRKKKIRCGVVLVEKYFILLPPSLFPRTS
jgi:hypothetical protein